MYSVRCQVLKTRAEGKAERGLLPFDRSRGDSTLPWALELCAFACLQVSRGASNSNLTCCLLGREEEEAPSRIEAAFISHLPLGTLLMRAD
jgi:hypothetical protein